jgi:hypothetical protein
MLSLGNAGLLTTTWRASTELWAYDRPSPMANLTDVNEKSYGHLAMTANGGAFAVTQVGDAVPKIENWQFQDDLRTWRLAGDFEPW